MKNISWKITGNYGYVDRDGYFTMIGRASRFYIISTLNKVYCEHVQRILSDVDVVESCAVVPKPDEKMLYVGAAYVVLKEGVPAAEETAAHILKACAQPVINRLTGETDMLQPYEIPAVVSFLRALPRTAADKIDYQYLEKLAMGDANDQTHGLSFDRQDTS